jgi:hypothetical protein
MSMGLFNWSRKRESTLKPDRTAPLGLDLTARRARVVRVSSEGEAKLVPLEEPAIDLDLLINASGRSPVLGQAGRKLYRKLPHLVVGNYLPELARPKSWNLQRQTFDAAQLMGQVFDRISEEIQGYDSVVLALPSYLTVPQVSTILPLVPQIKLPVPGTVVGSLAVVLDRIGMARQKSHDIDHRLSLPKSVLVVDVDDAGLSLNLITVESDQVKLVYAQTISRLGWNAWMAKLLDSLSGRCVQLCRRDPRDSGDLEQGMFDQVEPALDRAKAMQRTTITVRADHWYQDLVLNPEDWAGLTTSLQKQVLEATREFLTTAPFSDPIGAVWLTSDASRLPGLTATLHEVVNERTRVEHLPPEAIGQAAAKLSPRWRIGELPRVHLDTTMPFPANQCEARTKAPQPVRK